MSLLNDLILTLDADLLQAERNDVSAASFSPLREIREKMCKYVLLRVDSEQYALPVEGLAEIGPMPSITPLPNLPQWICGIIHQRGEIISVIDLHRLFGQEIAPGKRRSKLAVLHNGKMKVGIGIDQVIATISKPDSDRLPDTGGYLRELEPTVFEQALQIENETYRILQPVPFLDMPRLLNYQPPE